MKLPTPEIIDKNLKVIKNFIKWVFPGLPQKLVLRLIIFSLLILLSGMVIGYLARPRISLKINSRLRVAENELPNDSKVHGLETDDSRQSPSKDMEPEDNFISFDNKNWDTSWFYLDKEGYYCPLQRDTFKYYFIWSKKLTSFLGRFGYKLKTKPASLEYSETPGEVIFTQKQGVDELFEFYFPARNNLRVKHKYQISNEDGEKNLTWSDGNDVLVAVKPNTTIELEFENSSVVANTISSVFYVSYIPKVLENQTRVQKEFPYSYPVVDRPSPEDLSGIIGVGVDKNSCLKIEKILE